ncbi:Protein N-acetyltransferase, RimJ/RimL family [Mucilaginibacter pineti]|uniref:Protein N-acetyltransferase, RimJ/RimL family n=1 Tax=Mucilaginibacter pineti TaxID=1391627 RepID=A0A1G7AAM0_9SPHI|nr:GNAT family protein [Mucilaginibacter pineti]SDE11800.1 Protein N-acetyltransferase, RimJ/RimL family [Mucilaginibacter pineti]
MELNGNGFTLRTWKSDDSESLKKNADNTNISDFLFDRFPSPYTLAEAHHFIGLKMNQDPVTNFAITINDEVIGVIGLDLREDVYSKAPLLGYWLSEHLWGKGIMPQAIKLIVAYGFANFPIVRIQAGVLGNNPKSMRVLEKAGFTKEAVLKNAIIKNGIILDEHIYAILKPE